MRNAPHLAIIFLNNLASLFATVAFYNIFTDEQLAKFFNPFFGTVFLTLLKSHYTAPWASIVGSNADPPNYICLPIALLSIAAFVYTKPEKETA